MARYNFGGGADDFTFTGRIIGGSDYMTLAPSTLTLWSAQTGGTQYTDLMMGGSAVSTITVTASGQVPAFQGPDGVSQMWADGGAGRVLIDAFDAFEPRAEGLNSWPTFVYGNSYGILAAGWLTTGNHYSQKVAAALGGGAVTSYAISGKRILDVLSSVVNESAAPGLATAPVAGSKWPSTSGRNGLVILESFVNDIGHYPTMVGTAIPAALPTANTRYKDSLQVLYRAALAIMSSESRVEQSAGTYSGTWTQNTATSYASGGTISFTTAAAAYIEYSVTPPQSGPLAGKVFVLGYTVDPAAGTMAQQIISVDGTAQVTRTPSGWEQYTGPGGGNVNVAWDVAAVQVPIDGAAHTIRVAHNGSAGQLLYADCVIVPSTDPNPIIVPGAEHTLTAPTIWTAAQRGVYHDNARTLIPLLQAVVAEFPHAVYAPSTMTTNGLYSGDGIHPNDRGMAQRANDIQRNITKTLRMRLESRALSLRSDSTFGVI